MNLNTGSCYTLNFYDSYGDGICCAYGNGSYALTNNSNGSTLASGGSFGSIDSSNFCVSSSAKSLLSETTSVPAPATLSNFEVAVYPNPASNFIKFSTDYKVENSNYIIYNQTGVEVKKGVSTTNTISIEDITPGIYFITIKTENKTFNSKFIKQ